MCTNPNTTPQPRPGDQTDQLLQAKKRAEKLEDDIEMYWAIMFEDKYDELCYERDLLERQIKFLKDEQENYAEDCCANQPEIEFLSEKLEQIEHEIQSMLDDNLDISEE